jgi:uncharacterized protein (DUF305 family)
MEARKKSARAGGARLAVTRRCYRLHLWSMLRPQRGRQCSFLAASYRVSPFPFRMSAPKMSGDALMEKLPCIRRKRNFVAAADRGGRSFDQAVPSNVARQLTAVYRRARRSAALCALLFAASASTEYFSVLAGAQQTDAPTPVVVQPGAPGQPSKTLPPSTRATPTPRSPADVEFMQGMIMHHAQAVEMTRLIASHTDNRELLSLGARIQSSQSDEIKFMKRWLAARDEPISMAMPGMQGMDMPPDAKNLMPGMLTPEQMKALKNAKGAEFDRLFLAGMIQHHGGALTMVKNLFDTAGAGQDADLFNFATDADNTQRAEIRIMESMSGKKSSEENR